MPSLAQRETDYLQITLRAINAVLRWRWLVIGLPIVAGGISGTRSLLSSRSFTARSTFMTQSGPRPQTSSLAAQLGISVGSTGDPTLSPEFYSDLVRSRPVLLGVVRAKYSASETDTTRQPILFAANIDEERAVQKMVGQVSTAVNVRTGVITLSTVAGTAWLATQINREVLNQVAEFNRTRRRSRVGSERQFTEARLADAVKELRETEDALQDFLSRNRDFQGSADLRFKEQRLAREVLRRQQLYASLAQAFEQAKIDEVRDMPVITILEDPVATPNSRRTLDKVVLAVLMALLAGIGFAILREFLKGTRLRETDELSELRAHAQSFVAELRHPIASAQAAVLSSTRNR